MNEYLRQFIEALKQEYPEDTYEYEINEKLNYMEIKSNQFGEIFEIYIEWNEYQVPIKLIMTKANMDEEIITPESCHECGYENCTFYDAEKQECTITQEQIDKEIKEWQKTLYHSEKLTINQTVIEQKCYLDVPHYHLYKAHQITLNQSLLIETIKAVETLFDEIIQIATKQ